jgi:hypothetical protein
MSSDPVQPLQPPLPPAQRYRPPGYRQPGPTMKMTDDIDELILKLEDFAGLKALPQTAREIIQSAINDILREKILEVVRDARRFSEEYQAKVEAEAMKLLIEPERKSRRKTGLSNTQKAEYWDGLAQLFRRHMPPPHPDHPVQPAAQGMRAR